MEIRKRDIKRKYKDQCSFNRVSVLLMPVPSPVNTEGSVRKSIHHKTYKTYQIDQNRG